MDGCSACLYVLIRFCCGLWLIVLLMLEAVFGAFFLILTKNRFFSVAISFCMSLRTSLAYWSFCKNFKYELGLIMVLRFASYLKLIKKTKRRLTKINKAFLRVFLVSLFLFSYANYGFHYVFPFGVLKAGCKESFYIYVIILCG